VSVLILILNFIYITRRTTVRVRTYILVGLFIYLFIFSAQGTQFTRAVNVEKKMKHVYLFIHSFIFARF